MNVLISFISTMLHDSMNNSDKSKFSCISDYVMVNTKTSGSKFTNLSNFHTKFFRFGKCLLIRYSMKVAFHMQSFEKNEYFIYLSLLLSCRPQPFLWPDTLKCSPPNTIEHDVTNTMYACYSYSFLASHVTRFCTGEQWEDEIVHP